MKHLRELPQIGCYRFTWSIISGNIYVIDLMSPIYEGETTEGEPTAIYNSILIGKMPPRPNGVGYAEDLAPAQTLTEHWFKMRHEIPDKQTAIDNYKKYIAPWKK